MGYLIHLSKWINQTTKMLYTMKKNIFKITMLSVFITIITGCAGRSYISEYKYNDNYSYALNNLLAAGVMIEDGEIKDVEVDLIELSGTDAIAHSKSINRNEAVYDTLTTMEAAATFSGLTPPPIGISSGFHGGMLLLSLLDSPYKPSFIQDHMFAYMPVDMASSPEDARDVLANMLEEAAFKALPADIQYEKIVNHWKPTLGPKSVQHVTVLKGGPCEQGYVHFMGSRPSMIGCRLSIGLNKGNPPIMKSPEWVGGDDVYFFHPDFYRARFSSKAGPNVWVGAAAEKGLGLFEEIKREEMIRSNLGDLSRTPFLLRVSSFMPSWFYIYIAPKKDDPIPKLFNQGKVHYFVKYK